MIPPTEKLPLPASVIARRYYGIARAGAWVIVLVTPLQLAIAGRLLMMQSSSLAIVVVAISLIVGSRAAFWLRSALQETQPRLARWMTACGYALLVTAAVCGLDALRRSVTA